MFGIDQGTTENAKAIENKYWTITINITEQLKSFIKLEHTFPHSQSFFFWLHSFPFHRGHRVGGKGGFGASPHFMKNDFQNSCATPIPMRHKFPILAASCQNPCYNATDMLCCRWVYNSSIVIFQKNPTERKTVPYIFLIKIRVPANEETLLSNIESRLIWVLFGCQNLQVGHFNFHRHIFIHICMHACMHACIHSFIW